MNRTATIAILVLAMLVGSASLCAGSVEPQCDRLAQLPDSERVAAFRQLYYDSQETASLDEQMRRVNTYIAAARATGRHDDEALAISERAVLFYNNDLNDSIFSVLPHDLERLKTIGGWVYYYEVRAYIANTYLFLNQNNLGLHETQAMFDDARRRNDSFGMGLAYASMGTAYANLRNFEKSVECFQKSIDLLEALPEKPPTLPDVYTYYGNALNDMRDFQRLEQLTVQWRAFLDDFIAFYELEDTPTADLYEAYYGFACVQASLGLGRLAEADRQLADVGRRISASGSYLNLKWLYYMAQLKLQQGQADEALDYNTRRLEQLTDGSDQSVRIMVLQQRAEIMKLQGRHAEAADLYRDIFVLSDSANVQVAQGQIAEMNTIFQVSELEMEQQRLKLAKERSQLYFILIVVAVVLLSLAIFLFFRIRAARKLKQAHSDLQSAYSDLQQANEVIEQTTAAKERIESELRIARDIQMSMVPNVFPDRPDVDLFALMTPAKEVGGDLYNFLLVDDADGSSAPAGKLYFALGDVSGKGVPASLFMAQATRLFRTLAKQQLPPAEIATRMNGELAEDNEQGMFVTMFLGVVDLATGHLDFCNAGHNPPVLMGGGEARFIDMIPNAPIGLWPELDYEGEAIDDFFNHPLFIYTDGLNEAENKEQEQYGDDHLLQVLQDVPFASARQTVEMLRDEVERHRNGADPNDDLTMMCIHIKRNN